MTGTYTQGLAYNSPRPFSAASPSVAIFGTSITNQCSIYIPPPAANPSAVWLSYGYASWMRMLTNQRVNLHPKNNFGVSGNKFSDMLARINTVLASECAIYIVEGGTNDFPTITDETSYQTTVDTWVAIVQRLRSAGLVIVLPAPPRASGTLTTAQVGYQQRFTNFQREFCYANLGYIFCDYLGYWTDQTSALNIPRAGVTMDGIHPNSTGAYYMGKALADIINTLLPPLPTSFLPASDIYNATYNPTGNLLFSGTTNLGLLAGTGGVQSANAGLTYAGTGFATLNFFQRLAATSTATVTLSKENPRIDAGRLSGERQIIQLAAASGGGADEIYMILYTVPIVSVAVGDWIYAECNVEVTAAPVNIISIDMYMLETRPANSQASADMLFNTGGGLWPSVTYQGVMRSPPIQRQSDSTVIQMQVRIRAKTDAGAASVTMKLGDVTVRKVSPLLL